MKYVITICLFFISFSCVKAQTNGTLIQAGPSFGLQSDPSGISYGGHIATEKTLGRYVSYTLSATYLKLNIEDDFFTVAKK